MTIPTVHELRTPVDDLVGVPSITLLEWRVQEGESVIPGQVLLDIATPDFVLTVAAHTGGRISEILVAEGSPLEPGETLALLTERPSSSERS